MVALLTPLMAVLGPAAILLLMGVLFAETGLLAGFFLPGDSLLFTAGVLVASGAVPLPLWLVVLGAAVAAVAGDQLGYVLGRRLGPWLFRRRSSRLLSRVLSEHHLERAEAFFERHGPKAVVLARFVPLARTFTPAVAGAAQMPRRRFVAYNLLGAAGWTALFLVGGFFLGGIPLVAAHVELLAVGMVAVPVVPAAVAHLRHRRRRRTTVPAVPALGRAA
jgi:membrane protein DedA with SNARE-associated domain